jgi:hypothetical protein
MNVGDRVRVVRAIGDAATEEEGKEFVGSVFTIRNFLEGMPRPVQVEEKHDLLFHPNELEVIE